jgi:hypothetical protein
MASLLELVEALVRDPQAKAAYRADPDDFLGRHGFGELEPADLEEALHHAADSFPPALAAQVSPSNGLDSLVQVDLQELGYDDDLRPHDPIDDAFDGDTDDWRGPDLGDDVEFDAPLAHDGPVHDQTPEDTHDPRSDDGDPGDDGDSDGDGGRLLGAEAEFDTADLLGTATDIDRATEPDRDTDFDDGDDAPDGLVDAVNLGLEPVAEADWGDDDPWFYSEREPVLEEPDDFDDDIMDDVDDFHHDD